MYRYVQITKKTLGTTLLYIFYKMAYWEVWTITGKTSLIVPVSQTQGFYALSGKTDINARLPSSFQDFAILDGITEDR